MKVPHGVRLAAIWIGFALLSGWLAWLIASVRTMQFGPSLRLYAVTGIITFGILSLYFASAFPHKSMKLLAVKAAMATVVVLCLVEGYASVQERVMQKTYGPHCEEPVFEARWWPFQNSVIYCLENVWGGND